MGKLQSSSCEGFNSSVCDLLCATGPHVWVVIHVSKWAPCSAMLLLRPAIYTQSPQLDSAPALFHCCSFTCAPSFFLQPLIIASLLNEKQLLKAEKKKNPNWQISCLTTVSVQSSRGVFAHAFSTGSARHLSGQRKACSSLLLLLSFL